MVLMKLMWYFHIVMSGDEEVGFELVKQCKQACGDILLKVIIETGELKQEALIKRLQRYQSMLALTLSKHRRARCGQCYA